MMTHLKSLPGIRNVGRSLARLGSSAVVCSSLAVALLGCQEGKACERQRLDLAKAWTEVNQAAEDAKLSGGDEGQWDTIQKKLDVLQSAFATTQVTWDSARKNHDEAANLVGQINGSPSKTEIFRGTFKAAGDKQAAYFDACR